MSSQKTTQFKHSELNILKQLCEKAHPDLARKIQGYMQRSPENLLQGLMANIQYADIRAEAKRLETVPTFAGNLTILADEPLYLPAALTREARND